MSGKRSPEQNLERANKAIEHYAKRYKELHGNDAPMMVYESKWVLVSCRSTHMFMPHRKQIKQIETMTKDLELRLKHRGPNHGT